MSECEGTVHWYFNIFDLIFILTKTQMTGTEKRIAENQWQGRASTGIRILNV